MCTVNVYGVVFVFAWHVHGVCVKRCCVCSGKANDVRNWEHVVLWGITKHILLDFSINI